MWDETQNTGIPLGPLSGTAPTLVLWGVLSCANKVVLILLFGNTGCKSLKPEH